MNETTAQGIQVNLVKDLSGQQSSDGFFSARKDITIGD